MWGKRIATVVVLTTIASAGGIAPTAQAQTPGEPIYGDVDGDGVRDKVFLGSIQPDQCSVVVQYGRPGGILLPPVAYTYLRPGGTGVDINCPDIGVAVDLTTDNFDELVIGWSGGPPPSITRNLLALDHNFQPAFGIATFVSRPRYMNQADFNGDGRPDVYVLSSRDRGFETYYSLGDGTLTIGPMKWCAQTIDDFILKDFNRDGATAALLSYTKSCDDGANGVVKISSTGATQLLQHDPTATRTWKAQLAYANDDSLADVRTVERDTGKVDYFIQVPGGPVATFVKSPTANQDKITITGDKAVAIPVLANDYVTTAGRLTIVSPPKYGTVEVTSSRTVVYRPRTPHQASDRFTYRLTEGAKTSTAPVNIRFVD